MLYSLSRHGLAISLLFGSITFQAFSLGVSSNSNDGVTKRSAASSGNGIGISTGDGTGDEFPPDAWLGFGLDMTAVMPFDIRQVLMPQNVVSPTSLKF